MVNGFEMKLTYSWWIFLKMALISFSLSAEFRESTTRMNFIFVLVMYPYLNWMQKKVKKNVFFSPLRQNGEKWKFKFNSHFIILRCIEKSLDKIAIEWMKKEKKKKKLIFFFSLWQFVGHFCRVFTLWQRTHGKQENKFLSFLFKVLELKHSKWKNCTSKVHDLTLFVALWRSQNQKNSWENCTTQFSILT